MTDDMKINPYLSPDILGIDCSWFHALVKFVDGVRSGRIKDRPTTSDSKDFIFGKDILSGFDMSTIQCGAVGCIKGWCEWNFGADTNPYKGITKNANPPVLDSLFFPDLEDGYGGVTAQIAADVTEHFLKTGAVSWGDVGGLEED